MIYTVTKRIEIAGAHRLALPYESKCSNLHGHNWIVTVTCQTDKLNNAGMVVDFGEIKKMVMCLDHQNLNDHLHQPTAERLAAFLLGGIPHCIKVEVQESEGNTACVSTE